MIYHPTGVHEEGRRHKSFTELNIVLKDCGGKGVCTSGTWGAIRTISTWGAIRTISTWGTIYPISTWGTINTICTCDTVYTICTWNTKVTPTTPCSLGVYI